MKKKSLKSEFMCSLELFKKKKQKKKQQLYNILLA